jgi:hypothetical protein
VKGDRPNGESFVAELSWPSQSFCSIVSSESSGLLVLRSEELLLGRVSQAPSRLKDA